MVLALVAGCIREDEFACEDAVSRVARCCSDFPSHVFQCQAVFDLAGNMITAPDVTVAEAHCIVGRSCDSLVAAGYCFPTVNDSGHYLFPGDCRQ